MASVLQRELKFFVSGAGFASLIIFFTYTTMMYSFEAPKPTTALSDGGSSEHQSTFATANFKTDGETKHIMVSTKKTDTNTYLDIFHAAMESKEVQESVSKNKCIRYATRNGKTPICLHPVEKDVYVSGRLLYTGQWESGLVGLTANVLTAHPGMSFLDIGCNIGAFTIYMAKMGTRVVAVDASKENLLLLSRSLSLGKLHQNVTLVLNALSDTHGYVTLQEVTKNKGGTFVIPSEESDPGTIKTIKLDELAFMFRGQSLFIKMDIEGSEWRALNGGKRFFKTVDVRFVLMEFMFHRNEQSGKEICAFFTENGFRPYPVERIERSSVLDIAKYQLWPINVLWIKYLSDTVLPLYNDPPNNDSPLQQRLPLFPKQDNYA